VHRNRKKKRVIFGRILSFFDGLKNNDKVDSIQERGADYSLYDVKESTLYIEIKLDPGGGSSHYTTLKIYESEVQGETWEEMPLYEFLKSKAELWTEYFQSGSPYRDIAPHADKDEIEYIHGSQETEIIEVLEHLFPDRTRELRASRLAYVECFG
jgi:hypothetical protein